MNYAQAITLAEGRTPVAREGWPPGTYLRTNAATGKLEKVSQTGDVGTWDDNKGEDEGSDDWVVANTAVRLAEPPAQSQGDKVEVKAVPSSAPIPPGVEIGLPEATAEIHAEILPPTTERLAELGLQADGVSPLEQQADTATSEESPSTEYESRKSRRPPR